MLPLPHQQITPSRTATANKAENRSKKMNREIKKIFNRMLKTEVKTCRGSELAEDALAIFAALGIDADEIKITEIPLHWSNQIVICFNFRDESFELFADIKTGHFDISRSNENGTEGEPVAIEYFKTAETVTKYDILNNPKFAGYAEALHHIAGIDWQKPVDALIYSGAFTALKLRKAATAAGIDEGATLVCISWAKKWRNNKRWFAINQSNAPILDLHTETAYSFRVVNDYYTASAWNEYRKAGATERHGELQTLIIAQNPAYRAEVSNIRTKTISTDSKPIERLRNVSVIGGRCNNIEYVSQFDAIDEQGKRCHNDRFGRTIFSAAVTPETLEDVIDKSGYYIRGQRMELKRRAKDLKKERDRAKAEAYNATAEIEKLKAEIAYITGLTRRAYAEAVTVEEWEAVGDINDRWNGLPNIMRSVDRFTDRAKKGEFASVASLKECYNDLMNKIGAYAAKFGF